MAGSRFAFCESDVLWLGSPNTRPLPGDTVSCPGPCGQTLSFDDVGDVKLAVERFYREPGAQPVDLLRVGLDDIDAIERSRNLGYVWRLGETSALALQVRLQAKRNSQAWVFCDQILDRVVESIDSFRLPSALHTLLNPQYSMDDRVRACLAWTQRGPWAVDLMISEDLPARRFSPTELFVRSLLIGLSGDRALGIPLKALIAKNLRDQLLLPCGGTRELMEIIAGAGSWCLGSEDLDAVERHIATCTTPRHHDAWITVLPQLAGRGLLADAVAVERIHLYAPKLAETALKQLASTTDALSKLTLALGIALDLAARTKTPYGQVRALESVARAAKRTHAELVRFGAQPPDQELQHIASVQIEAFLDHSNRPRDNATVMRASVSAFGRYRQVRRHLGLPDFAAAELGRWGTQVAAALDGSRATDPKQPQPDRPDLERRLVWLDSTSFEFVRATVEQPGFCQREDTRASLLSIIARRPAKMLVNRPATVPPQPLPGWMSSAYLAQVRGGAEDPMLSGLGEKGVAGFVQAQGGLQNGTAPTWHTYSLLASFALAFARSIDPHHFWGAMARNQWCLEAMALAQRAYATAGADDPFFQVEKNAALQRHITAAFSLDPFTLDLEIALSQRYATDQDFVADGIHAQDVEEAMLGLNELGQACSRSDWQSAMKRLCGVLPQDSVAENVARRIEVLTRDAIPDAPSELLWDLVGMARLDTRRPALVNLSRKACAPRLIEEILTSLSVHQEGLQWFGPPADHLGELLALIRRDPGLGQHWHGPIYPALGLGDPSVSFVTLARMRRRVRCLSKDACWQSSLPSTRGELEDGFFAALRGAIASVGAARDARPYRDFICEEYGCKLRRFLDVLGLSTETRWKDDEVFVPRSLLSIIDFQHPASLMRHLLENPRNPHPLHAGVERFPQSSDRPALAIWYIGSSIWDQNPRPLEGILADATVTRHHMMRPWQRFYVVVRHSDGCLHAHSIDGKPSMDVTKKLPELAARLNTGPWVAYLHVVARHEAVATQLQYNSLCELTDRLRPKAVLRTNRGTPQGRP